MKHFKYTRKSVNLYSYKSQRYSMFNFLRLNKDAIPTTSTTTTGQSVDTHFNVTLDKIEKNIHPKMVKEGKGGSFLNIEEIFGDILQKMNKNIKQLVTSNHPFMNTINTYYLNSTGKHLRPLIVVLLSKALSHLNKVSKEEEETIMKRQQKLAEITEMIHTASLLHDDVLDNAHSRRCNLSSPYVFGNKASILSGDYLLATASIELSKLNDIRVVQYMASSISDLVYGEFMQLDTPPNSMYQFNYYIEKSFRKTASLIANSCKSVAALGKFPEDILELSYAFGKNFGIAFQLMDDKLDFDANEEELGKTVGADLANGIITAPILYAIEKFPKQIKTILDRRFEHPGDMKLIWQYIKSSQALEQTESLALYHSTLALDSLKKYLPTSNESDLLVELTNNLNKRRK